MRYLEKKAAFFVRMIKTSRMSFMNGMIIIQTGA